MAIAIDSQLPMPFYFAIIKYERFEQRTPLIERKHLTQPPNLTSMVFWFTFLYIYALGPWGGDFSPGCENDDGGSKPDNQHDCKETTFTSIDLGSFLNQIVKDSKN